MFSPVTSSVFLRLYSHSQYISLIKVSGGPLTSACVRVCVPHRALGEEPLFGKPLLNQSFKELHV